MYIGLDTEDTGSEDEPTSRNQDEVDEDEGRKRKGNTGVPSQGKDKVQKRSCEYILDDKGREHIAFNRSGRGFCFIGSSQLSPSTPQGHFNDLT